MSWKIRVEGGNLSFSAAHFITLEGSHEPLHGHNYEVSVELAGESLTEDSYLLDFGEVKALMRAQIATVNHRFLLPLHNSHLRLNETGAGWELLLDDGERFVFPHASVVPLPVDNVTAERLAEYFAGKIWGELSARGIRNLSRITMGVSETAMQTAYHTLDIAELAS